MPTSAGDDSLVQNVSNLGSMGGSFSSLNHASNGASNEQSRAQSVSKTHRAESASQVVAQSGNVNNEYGPRQVVTAGAKPVINTQDRNFVSHLSIGIYNML
jgi:hypothetical protein